MTRGSGTRLLPVAPDFQTRAAPPDVRIAIRRAVQVALAWLVLAATPALAWDETKRGLRLSVLDDITVGAGSVLVSARYGGGWGLKAGAWVRDIHVVPGAPNVLLGANYVWTYSKLRFGAGVVWIDQENSNNGTRWNFDFTISYDLSDRVFCEYQHNSHGSTLGIKKEVSNQGWNLLGIGFVF
jgi:hypothetical protein